MTTFANGIDQNKFYYHPRDQKWVRFPKHLQTPQQRSFYLRRVQAAFAAGLPQITPEEQHEFFVQKRVKQLKALALARGERGFFYPYNTVCKIVEYVAAVFIVFKILCALKKWN